MGNFINKIKKIFSSNKDEEIKYRSTHIYVKDDEEYQNDAETILKDIKRYKLPFDISIDNNGNIIESYQTLGHPYGWKCIRDIYLDDFGFYQTRETFMDSNGYSFERTIVDEWLREFNFINEEGEKVFIQIKLDPKKNKNYIVTEETNNLYKATGQKVYLDKPIDALSWFDIKKYYYQKRQIYVSDYNKNEMILKHCIGFNPYDNGDKCYLIEVPDNHTNIFDGNLYGEVIV